MDRLQETNRNPMTLIENAVTLADLAKVIKKSRTDIEAECRQLDLFIGEDWARRPAVSTIDASALTTGTARREHDHAIAWRAHHAATEAWEAERMAVHRAAYQAARTRVRSTGEGDPAANAAGREASREAVE